MRLFLADNARFIRANLRWIGGCFLLTLFSSFGQTFFVGLSGNALRAQFDLSGGEFGGLYMAATLVSAATLPWLGRTLDLMPGWKVVRFTLPSLAVACVLLALAPGLAVLARGAVPAAPVRPGHDDRDRLHRDRPLVRRQPRARHGPGGARPAGRHGPVPGRRGAAGALGRLARALAGRRRDPDAGRAIRWP